MTQIAMPLLGGAMVGAASALLWLVNRRVAGISGIVGGVFGAPASDRTWRLIFLAGLVLGGALMSRVLPAAFAPPATPMWLTAVSGVLVGVGTTLANGCTSGHGICGNSRLSPRSMIATCTFIAAGMMVVFCMRLVCGAGP